MKETLLSINNEKSSLFSYIFANLIIEKCFTGRLLVFSSKIGTFVNCLFFQLFQFVNLNIFLICVYTLQLSFRCGGKFGNFKSMGRIEKVDQHANQFGGQVLFLF